MLSYGNQIRAARALCGLSQTELAEQSSLNVNTIRAMEGRADRVLTSSLETVRKVERAFEELGVFFQHDSGSSGVCRKHIAKRQAALA